MTLKPWPYVFAAGILALGLHAFVQKYPGVPARVQRAGAPTDSVLPSLLSDGPKIVDTGGVATDTLAARDPFHTPMPAHDRNQAAIPKAMPRRNWTLTGTVGDVVAMLIDSAGVKHLLRVGESVGGAELMEVRGDHARLRDAGGEFEIGLAP